MFGYILAVLTAVFASVHDSFINRSSKISDPYVVALAIPLFSFPLVVFILFWIGIPGVNRYFWFAVMAKIPLMSLASIFRAKAHQKSDQSLIVPMLCFTPVFVMILAPFFLHQSIGIAGIIGVVILALGAYVMGIKERNRGVFGPFWALYSEPGVRYMLLVSFIWGLTATLDGVGVINAGGTKGSILLSFKASAYWLFWTQIVSAILMGIIVAGRMRKKPTDLEFRILIPIGLSNGFMSLTQMCALGLIPAVYVIAIKRLSIIFSVFIGHYYFKEEGFKERIVGSILMVLGFILIILSKYR